MFSGNRPSRARVSLLFLRFLACVLIVCCPVAFPVHAQQVSAGSIQGQITDPQGAAVVGAMVTLTDKATGQTRSMVSNDTGRYDFAQVPVGDYDIAVAKEGFSQSKVASQHVDIGTVITIPIQLKVGATSQTVEVTATVGAELQSNNATMGTTLDTTSMQLLPNISRDASTLATLQPGVTPTGQTTGVREDQNTYQLDGGNISDDMAGGNNTYTPSFALSNPVGTGGNATGAVPTPVESIEEVKVNVANQTADFGNSAGSQVIMATRRGTNQFHGSLYDYYLDTKIGQANTWDNNRLGLPTASTHRNRFGGSVGGPIGKRNFLGGKTFFFVNYEGLRYPYQVNIEKLVPTATFRAGLIGIQEPGSPANTPTFFNLNPVPVMVNGVTYQPSGTAGAPGCSASGIAACDPRGLGLNSDVAGIWSTMPLPNDPAAGDTINTQGYIGAAKLPVTSNFGVIRLDHDFGAKWHWMASYRYYRDQYESTNQIDIGGVLSGDTAGVPASKITRPVIPSYYVTALTTNITNNVTNSLNFNFTRNFWLWNSALVPPNIAGVPAPLEIGGESANALIPYNVDAQDVRERYWDGKDLVTRDDVSWIKGNHLFQFGGLYQRNDDTHQRDDNGVQTLAGLVYISGGSQASQMTLPSTAQPQGCTAVVTLNCVPAGQAGTGGTWSQLYEEALGIVTLPQTIFTRSGSNFTLNNPPTSPATSEVVIPSYNIYFNDTWHMKSSFTLSYGLGYTIEMPPYDVSGVQTSFVYADGSLVTTNNFLQQRQQAALNGQIFLPEVGYEQVHNTGRKYAYNPFYKGFAPHLSAAWSPSFDSGILGDVFGHGKTVVRGGWSRIFGRLNGVDLVLVPMLGDGPLQVVTCAGPINAASAGGGAQCNTGNSTPTTAFRIGTDGNTAPFPTVSNTLSQPNIPGFNSAATGDTSELDPNFKPNRSDEFTLSVQRELPGRMLLEVGYIGRILKNEYQAVELSSVPYMMTLGNQEFVGAFDSVYNAVQTTQFGGQGLTINAANCGTGSVSCPLAPQAFLEAAFRMPAGSPGSVVLNGNTVSSYCAGFVSCTAAVANKQASNVKNVALYTMWTGMPMTFGQATALNSSGTPVAVPTLYGGGSGAAAYLNSISMETSDGWGNYNAAIVSLTSPNYHGLTVRSNFTWGRALGTGDYTQATSSTSLADPFDLQRAYGVESYDFRFLYNLTMLYQVPYFKSQHGLMGHLLGGWAIAPIFTANSGAPLRVTAFSGCSPTAWGAVPCNLGGYENASIVTQYTQGNSLESGGLAATGSSGIGTSNKTGLSLFSNPAAAYADFLPTVPGVNQSSGGAGILRGFPTWNLDATVSKDINFGERMGLTLIFSFTNVLNHVQYSTPSLSLSSPTTFGNITSSTGAVRQLETGLRFHF